MQKIARRLRKPITLKISRFCINKVSNSVKVVQKIFITPQVGLGVLILVLIAAVIVIPMWQVKALSVTLEKRLELEDKARATLTQIIGGVSIGLYFALRNIRATERNVKVAEEKASTERFSRAIDMLGDKGNIHARLGGIHALEQLAKYVPEYAVIVLNVLSSFVREEARLDHFQSTDGHSFPSRPPIDIQEAIRAIGRRNTKRDPERIPLIDLEYTNLSGLVIYSLDGDLTFKLASFRQANLQNSQILGVDLRRADMSDADLRHANLFGTNLQGANFESARLQGAILSNADLRGAKLTLAEGLTQEQISTAIGDSHTGLPEGLFLPEYWKISRLSSGRIAKVGLGKPLLKEHREELQQAAKKLRSLRNSLRSNQNALSPNQDAQLGEHPPPDET